MIYFIYFRYLYPNAVPAPLIGAIGHGDMQGLDHQAAQDQSGVRPSLGVSSLTRTAGLAGGSFFDLGGASEPEDQDYP